MKYLKLYKKWMRDKEFPYLCHAFGNNTGTDDSLNGIILDTCDPLFALFIPNREEMEQHIKDGYCNYAWDLRDNELSDQPTDLRQNIILLMAALNGEL